MATASLPSPLLNSQQAADLLGTSAATLAVYRCNRRIEIPYIKIGKAVRYRREDLEKFIAARVVGGVDQDQAQ